MSRAGGERTHGNDRLLVAGNFPDRAGRSVRATASGPRRDNSDGATTGQSEAPIACRRPLRPARRPSPTPNGRSRCCSTRQLGPDRRHGAPSPATDLRGGQLPTGAVAFRRPTTAYENVAGRGRHEPARRPVDRPLRRARRRARRPPPAPAPELLPVRVRPGRPALRPPGRARSVRDPLGRPQLGGPGRPPGRARLARGRAGAGAVRDRRARACGPTALVPRAAGSWTSRPTIAALLGVRAARDDGAHLAGQDGEVAPRRARPRRRRPRARRRLPVRRHQPERARTTMAAAGRGAERRPPHRDGHRVRARRDGGAADRHARQPHVDPHRPPARAPRHPQQRLVRPRHRPAGDHELARDLADGDADAHARRRVAARRRPPHVAGRVHGVGERAVRHRRRLLHVRLLPARRGAADPDVARRAAALDRAVRAPVEGLLVVDDRRPHGRRAGRRASGAATTATSTTRCRASCG